MTNSLQCPYCPKSYVLTSHLVNHIKRKHYLILQELTKKAELEHQNLIKFAESIIYAPKTIKIPYEYVDLFHR